MVSMMVGLRTTMFDGDVPKSLGYIRANLVSIQWGVQLEAFVVLVRHAKRIDMTAVVGTCAPNVHAHIALIRSSCLALARASTFGLGKLNIVQ